MRLEFSKSALKFLRKLDKNKERALKQKVSLLYETVSELREIPFDQLDIKRLKGDWQGYYRIRAGQIRVIFDIRWQEDVLYIHRISYRGGAYD